MKHSMWYVIHCVAQRDRQVERLLAHAGMEAFAARVPRTRKRNGDKALFPGYVFVRLDLEAGSWSTIRSRPGVRSLVEIGGGPCPVADEIVEVLRERVAGYTISQPQLQVGDRVAVTGGIFADLEGVFCELVSGAERVAILLDIMRRQVRVELCVDAIRPTQGSIAA
jgi:transcriptional antiterminator RfaH